MWFYSSARQPLCSVQSPTERARNAHLIDEPDDDFIDFDDLDDGLDDDINFDDSV